MNLTAIHEDLLELFNLEYDDVENIWIENKKDAVYVNVLLRAEYPPCPNCGCTHVRIKEYRYKQIRHSALTYKKCVIRYKARRYECDECGRTYFELNPFTFEKMNISALTVHNVLTDLKDHTETFSSVAARYYISPTTSASIFDRHVIMERLTLPEFMCWDEVYAFNYKALDSKYVFVILNFETIEPIDVLPSRRKSYLESYFLNIPLKERKKVKMIATDMFNDYRGLIRDIFPHCYHVIDRYHVIQELNRKVDKVRIRVMKSHPHYVKGTSRETNEYYLLKKFNWLIYKRDDSVDLVDVKGKKEKHEVFDPDHPRKYNRKLDRYLNYYEIRDLMKEIDPDLKKAWELKDSVTSFYSDYTYDTADEALKELSLKCRKSGIKEMAEFGRTLKKWEVEIVNSFIEVKNTYAVDKETGQVVVSAKHMNTGLLENRNAIIKCIKKNANGYKNWDRFRNRLLYVLRDSAVPRLNPVVPEKKKENDDGDKNK